MIQHKESHVDHVPQAVIDFVLDKFLDKNGFFIETFELPDELPTLENALYGPICGDKAIGEVQATYGRRGDRDYESRLIDKPVRQTSICTVIGGPHDGHPCVLYTVFGGPQAAKEVNDPTLKPEEREDSITFWSEHALAK